MRQSDTQKTSPLMLNNVTRRCNTKWLGWRQKPRKSLGKDQLSMERELIERTGQNLVLKFWKTFTLALAPPSKLRNEVSWLGTLLKQRG